MATKYQRTKNYGRSRLDATNYLPYRRLARLTPRQRLSGLFFGIAIFTFIMAMQQGLMKSLRTAPLEEADGIVRQLRIDEPESGDRNDSPAYVIAIEIPLPDEGSASVLAETDAETWAQLKEGDTISVFYQRSPDGRQIRVRRIGSLAPSPPNE